MTIVRSNPNGDTFAAPSDLPADHCGIDDQVTAVGGDLLTTPGRVRSEAQPPVAGCGDPLLPPVPAIARSIPEHEAPGGWKVLRVWAEMYEDAQKSRIACTNRAERAGVDPALYQAQLDGLAVAEHQIKLAMVRCYRTVTPPGIVEWQKASAGIGEHLLARLLGVIGHPVHATPHHWEGEGAKRVLIADPPFDRNIAKLWAYCGHGDPGRKRAKGMTAEQAFGLGNSRAKMLVWNLSVACMRQRSSPYRIVYDAARLQYDEREWTDGHRHAAALRKVGKEVLRDLWIVAKDTE